MNEKATSAVGSETEERLVLELLDRLAAGHEEFLQDRPGGNELPAELERESLETLASLPMALEPAEPSPGLRTAILRRIENDEPKGEGRGGGPRRRPSRHRKRWLLPLAAGLVGALVGVSAWQLRRVNELEAVVDHMRQDLAALSGQGAELTELRREVADNRSRLTMVTTPGAEYCRLKPAGETPLYPQARGAVVLAADRKGWFLRVAGLGPAAAGSAYKIWFVTEDRTVAGPSFGVARAGEEIQLTDGAAPDDLRAIVITLEEEPVGELPSGPEVLHADEAMRIL